MPISPRTGFAIVALLAASLPAAVAAHVKVYAEPGWTQVPACTSTEFVVFVPNERPSNTIRLDLDIPPGVVAFDTEPKPGWSAGFTTTKGIVSRITWSGGQLHPREYAKFTFLASAPQHPQVLSWNAHQTYDDGTVVHWTGAPGSDTPHSQIAVSAPQRAQDCRPRRRR